MKNKIYIFYYLNFKFIIKKTHLLNEKRIFFYFKKII